MKATKGESILLCSLLMIMDDRNVLPGFDQRLFISQVIFVAFAVPAPGIPASQSALAD